jgi:hypothetical protein
VSEIAAANITRGDELDDVLAELTDLTSRRDSAVTSLEVAAALDGDGDRSLLDEVAQASRALTNAARLATYVANYSNISTP